MAQQNKLGTVLINQDDTSPAPSTARLLDSLTRLRELVSDNDNATAFAIEEGASCHERFLELRRLERSLDQYQSRTGQPLTYVGLLGHFSAGKSSTINALLEGTTEEKRATGQHPTDRAVTLITHSENAHSLIGMHRRGEIEVAASLQDEATLREIVLVDTPGSGDPLIVEEMVRDFLPICDYLLYVFSAAVPLDTTDLPILLKAHSELPFIPLRFVITRADEFKSDHDAPLTESNFDQQAADHFVGEFISRLEAAITGLQVKRDHFVLIDNRSSFRLDALHRLVKETQSATETGEALHTHKLRYFNNSAARIRQQLTDHLKGTLSAQDALLKAAKDNHARYQQTVAMSHSRLTENWQLQHHQLSSLRTAHSEALSELAFPQPLPDRIEQLPATAAAISAATDASKHASTQVAATLCSALESRWQQEFEATRESLVETVTNAGDPEVVALTMQAPTIIPDGDGGVQNHFSPDQKFRDALVTVYSVIPSELTDLRRETIHHSDSIAEWLAPDRLFKEATELLDSSEQQLAEMLDGFLESVEVYKAAVLSLNARELAERAGIVRAIDALERVDIPATKRETWLRSVTQRIFPDRKSHDEHSRSETERLCTTVTQVQDTFKEWTFTGPPENSSTDVAPLPDSSKRSLTEALEAAAQTFQQHANRVLQTVYDAKENVLAEHKITLMETVARLRDDKKRVSRTFGAGGAVVGVILFFLASTVLPLFQPFSIFSIGIGLVLVTAGVFGGFQLAGKFDPSRGAIDDCCKDYRERARTAILDSLVTLECSGSRLTQAQTSELAGILHIHWQSCLTAVVRTSAEKHRPAYEELRKTREQFESLRNQMENLNQSFYRHCEGFYQDVDGNLEQLAAISTEIKEDAILPSFHLFESRANDLSALLTEIRSIHFEAEHAVSAIPASTVVPG